MTTLHGKEIKVGDKVWCFKFGWDKVTHIHEGDANPIVTANYCYTMTGIMFKNDTFPCLFWQVFEIPAHAFEKPVVKVKAYLVLYKYNENYSTTSSWSSGYYLSKESFKEAHELENYKFISLIMESEIEVEE